MSQPVEGKSCDVRLPSQGASNSDRNVTIMNTRRLAICSTVRPNASRLVGSLERASQRWRRAAYGDPRQIRHQDPSSPQPSKLGRTVSSILFSRKAAS